MLMAIGPLQFEVYPLNTHEWDHTTSTEYARKEIAGIRPLREWVGEDDEEIYIRGRVYPYHLGGMANLEALDALRAQGMPQPLIRGDGWAMGWFNVERFNRTHTELGAEGVGQIVTFEAMLVRSEPPSGDSYFSALYSVIA